MAAGDNQQQVARWVRRAAWAVVALGVCGFLIDGVKLAPRPKLVPAGTELAAPGAPGLYEVAVTLSPGPGRAYCALEARSARQRRDLVAAADFRRYSGLVVVLPEPARRSLPVQVKGTRLVVDWFAASGSYIGGAAVRPCPLGAACVIPPPPQPFHIALEVAASQRSSGPSPGPGTAISLIGPCIG